MNSPDSQMPAQQLSQMTLAAFEEYFARFQDVTRGAQQRFEQACWNEIHELSCYRRDLYKEIVVKTRDDIRARIGAEIDNPSTWATSRQEYAMMINEMKNYEIAETFFNSIFHSTFQHQKINNRYVFIESSRPDCPLGAPDEIVHCYDTAGRSNNTDHILLIVEKMLHDYHFGIAWENQARDAGNIYAAILENIVGNAEDIIRIDTLKSVFFRNKGAYIVGRVVRSSTETPFVIPLLHNENSGVYADAIIFGSDDISIIFSFTRSYFMVEATIPSQIVGFLKMLMPNKGLAELYTSIGLNRHGKTEFYRDFTRHLQQSDDNFIIAPGIKGMVMSVFTLPSYDIVFKVIKDRFDPPKEATHEMVKEKYRLVSRHDRVGRMADTQEYENFHFPRNRFSQELILELQHVAPSILVFTDEELIIRHLYTERKMVPLNLFLQQASAEETNEVMDEYGNAIKQIACANIFAGDMLLKNFGVTRHKGVVFYDYDEICFLTECNFRRIPEPVNDEQAMASTPWYSVGPNDIFPEEFRLFFTGNPTARKAFEQHHSDLYTVEFWQGLQQKIRDGKVEDIFPYRRKKRFMRTEE